MTGPVSAQIHAALQGEAVYRNWRAGAASTCEFAEWAREQNPGQFGLNADQLGLATRTRGDEAQFVDECLEELQRVGLIDSVEYPKHMFASTAERMDRQFEHGGYSTYIFPEEARLLFALSYLAPGGRWAFLGSYYGYWAAWAMEGLIQRGGEAVLVDVDPVALDLSRRNFDALGWDGAAAFLAADATRPLDRGEFDVCVLDAEGPKEHADHRLRDKAIYGPILDASLQSLKWRGLVIAHNMMFSNPTRIDYFDEKIARNVEQYAEFQSILDHHFEAQTLIESAEGIGVYKRSDRRV